MISPTASMRNFASHDALTLGRERCIDVRTVLILARKELRDSFRNRWFVSYTAAFAVLAIGLSYLTRVGTTMSGFAGFGATVLAKLKALRCCAAL